MCYYKRVVFQCNHAFFGDMTRKCYLQLAYENAECATPCGKQYINPIQSIKVQVPCQECSVKFTNQGHKIAAIKQQISRAKEMLKIGVDSSNTEDADDEKGENETLSPVSLLLSERPGAEMASSSTGPKTREEEEKEKEKGMCVGDQTILST